MGKSLLEQIENKIYWGILGTILTMAFGAIGLYSYFHTPKPSILFEIINESNVLDVHKPLEDLTIFFENENIQKKNLNLRIFTIQISNNGEVDILQSYYDKNINWGFRVDNGKIINDARIITSNSEYLKSNLSPHVMDDNVVELEKVILEKGKYFSIEILVLHNKETLPEIKPIGKVVSIENIIPVKTWEQNLEPRFWDKFFYGGFLINILRPIIILICLILLIISIVISVDKIGDIKKNRKKKYRKKEVLKLFGGEPEDENIKILSNSYINEGIRELKYFEKLISGSEKLIFEIKMIKLEQEYETKIKEMEKTQEADEDDELSKEIEYIYSERYYPSMRYLRYYRPQLRDLVGKNILDIDPQDELIVDPILKKNLTKMIKYLEKKG